MEGENRWHSFSLISQNHASIRYIVAIATPLIKFQTGRTKKDTHTYILRIVLNQIFSPWAVVGDLFFPIFAWFPQWLWWNLPLMCSLPICRVWLSREIETADTDFAIFLRYAQKKLSLKYEVLHLNLGLILIFRLEKLCLLSIFPKMRILNVWFGTQLCGFLGWFLPTAKAG